MTREVGYASEHSIAIAGGCIEAPATNSLEPRMKPRMNTDKDRGSTDYLRLDSGNVTHAVQRFIFETASSCNRAFPYGSTVAAHNLFRFHDMSLELRQRLFAELDSLVLIDPHTHISPLAPAATTLADILGYHYYTELAHSAGLAKERIEEPGLDPKEQVARLMAALGPIDNT